MRLGFARWVSDAPSGGNLYDHELIAGLRAAGVEVVESRIGGFGPTVEPDDLDQLTAGLRAEPLSLVDGIAAGRAPQVVAAAVAAGHRVIVVVHHFGADDPKLDEETRNRYAALEGEALRAATGVLCTSQWAAGELARRYGLDDVGVAPPGIDPTDPAPGSRLTGGAPRILALGSLTPTKDQLTLVAALEGVADLAWTAHLVGSETVDPRYVLRLRAAIDSAGLDNRVVVVGARIETQLAAEWSAADLLVHPSRSETYGIVVLEALARGIPAIVSAGTGAVEPLGAGRTPQAKLAGTAIPPAQPAALASVLRRWLTDPVLAQSWRAAAMEQRVRLPGWSATAAAALAYTEKHLRVDDA